jgi:allophanate hydrolase
MKISTDHALHLERLKQAYGKNQVSVVEVIRVVYERLRRIADPGIFIHLISEADALEAAIQLDRAPTATRGELFGVPFAVKDNIDVAGLPTTAACPAFSYIAEHTAPAVAKLLAAGAILIGKTNLDQFATGLVGVRSPYPLPKNAFDPSFIPGGSSSGSAVAVAMGLVSFALGTDTAGSGRVPAAMNNVVGAKPTRGMVSTSGVVPACRAQDCVSVFGLTVSDCQTVLKLMSGSDAGDPYSRAAARSWDPSPATVAPSFRFGIPKKEQWVFDDEPSRASYLEAISRLEKLGGTAVQFDFEPFAKAASLLYGGAWVAQRLEATAALLERDPETLHPVIRQIVAGAREHTALGAFQAEAERQASCRDTEPVWKDFEWMLLPTIPGPCTLTQVEAEPIARNSRLGTYTNFVNLLDLCALAVPAGFGSDGIPRGVTLVAPAGRDGVIAGVGQMLHESWAKRLGAFEEAPPALHSASVLSSDVIPIVVAGAHMSGQPLNPQLTNLGARFVRTTHTAKKYRFYALATTPPKPGLVKVLEPESGYGIECEQWALSPGAFGSFMALLPSPMCIGRVELEDGSLCLGFLCEPYSVEGAAEISELGSWRRYVASKAKPA